jgi:DeoR/GlpR family transcriptional regulator of sugar metabolism
LRRPNVVITGSFSEMMLDLIQPTKAFMGCDSIEVDRGLNCPDFDQATFKRRSMATTAANWVLADYTKFSTPAAFPYWARCRSIN